jgi:hypothetical protein
VEVPQMSSIRLRAFQGEDPGQLLKMDDWYE